MDLLILSFVAGVLTVAVPCILPLLPVIVGGSLTDEDKKHKYLGSIVIVLSLALSVVIFGLLLKASTSLIGVPNEFWQVVSGGIVFLFGLTMIFPRIWETIMVKTRLNNTGNKIMGRGLKSEGFLRNSLLGLSLGPIFSSCSPTYALIVAVILPVSFAKGFIYLVSYALGLAFILFLISILGRKVTEKLKWASDPNGWFRKTVGILFVIVGIVVIFGFDKDIQAYVLEKGWYDPISNIEQKLN
jgi:cytochrome c-type biogenesis protein